MSDNASTIRVRQIAGIEVSDPSVRLDLALLGHCTARITPATVNAVTRSLPRLTVITITATAAHCGCCCTLLLLHAVASSTLRCAPRFKLERRHSKRGWGAQE